MQHSTVLCFRFRLERRLKFWQRQRGCAKSKRHFFYRGFKGALFNHWAFGPLFAAILISGTSPGLVQPLIALRLRATTTLDMLNVLGALRSMLSLFVRDKFVLAAREQMALLASRRPLHASGIELNQRYENAGCFCRLSCALDRGRIRLRGSPGRQLLLPLGAGRRGLPHLLAPVEGR